MIEAQVFFRQAGMERIELPGILGVGDFLRDGGDGLHRVDGVVWGHDGTVSVFAVPISSMRADELEAE